MNQSNPQIFIYYNATHKFWARGYGSLGTVFDFKTGITPAQDTWSFVALQFTQDETGQARFWLNNEKVGEDNSVSGFNSSTYFPHIWLSFSPNFISCVRNGLWCCGQIQIAGFLDLVLAPEGRFLRRRTTDVDLSPSCQYSGRASRPVCRGRPPMDAHSALGPHDSQGNPAIRHVASRNHRQARNAC